MLEFLAVLVFLGAGDAPPALVVGESRVVTLSVGANGSTLPLRVEVAETLTILAECVDGDVTLRVTDATGSPLAADDDAGTETDARVTFTPDAPATLDVALAWKDGATGRAWVCVLRGALALDPPDPQLAARSYWELALDSAVDRGDAARAAGARERLAALGALSTEDSRAQRDSVLADAVASVSAAPSSGDALASALERIEALPGSAADAVVAAALVELGRVAERIRDPRLRLACWGRVATLRGRTLPPDHPDAVSAAFGAALATRAVQGPQVALPLLEAVSAARERTLPATDHVVVETQRQLGLTCIQTGDLARAVSILEPTLAVIETHYAADDPLLTSMRKTLANVLEPSGELARARTLYEQVLASEERSLPAGAPTIQFTRDSLALVLRGLGDLAAARDLQERAVAALDGVVPDENEDMIILRANLATTLSMIGDYAGARAILERVLGTAKRARPDDVDLRVYIEIDLAVARKETGDVEGAATLEREALADAERLYPPDHPIVFSARQNLTTSLSLMGRHAEVILLQEQLLAARERTLPADHPDVQYARTSLAASRFATGDAHGALALDEQVLAVDVATLPEDHPDRIKAIGNVASDLRELHEAERLAATLVDLAASARRRLASGMLLSDREAAAIASKTRVTIAKLLSFGPECADPEAVDRAAFEVIESRRMFAQGFAGALARLSDPELEGLRARVARSRDALAAQVASLRAVEPTSRADRATIAAAALERDRAERDMRAALVAHGAAPPTLDLADLAQRLPARSAAVAMLKYTWLRTGVSDDQRGIFRFVAHIVTPAGALTRVELGDADAIEAAVEDWRTSIGAPADARGVALVRDPEMADDAAMGERLRALVLDPILAAAHDADTLIVCPDEALHLVPLDALPLRDGCVGDRIRIRIETSFARWVAPERPASATEKSPRLVTIGAVDFDASPTDADGRPHAASLVAMLREGGVEFDALPATADETRAVAALFEQAFDARAELLDGAAATKGAFAIAAPRARFLHVATHGYFGVPVAADDSQELGETLTDFTPLALCALALAGANGSGVGILSGEELAGLDLSDCELAVLSACDTNVGWKRGGIGIQSLQSALHAAGARSAVTSLWRVSDAAARELITDFYRRLWIEGQSKADALWNSKLAVRKRGAPLRDWAGWVLTGDP